MNRRICLAGILICFILCMLTGCGNKVVEGVSPTLTDYTLEGECEGDESSQFVVLTLQFDREIAYDENFADDLRITIADIRQKSEDFQISQDTADSITLKIPVTAITTGNLHLEPLKKDEPLTGIYDKTENAPAYPFIIDAIIPSGVELEEVSSDIGTVSEKVVSAWDIRSITWVQLWVDNELVQPVANDNLEVLDGAVAVHGHDFLISDEFAVAEEIAETLQGFYGDEYKFTAQNDIVTVSTTGNAKTLELKIYGKHDLSLSEVR